MTRPRTRESVTPSKADLSATRRQFLLAREQAAAQGSAERYFAARAMRHWPEHGGHPAADRRDPRGR
jgi:hypothetical protein